MGVFEDLKVTDQMRIEDIKEKLVNIHVRQRSNWDCGLACVQMVLNWASKKSALNTNTNNSNENNLVASSSSICDNSSSLSSSSSSSFCVKQIPEHYYDGNLPLWTIDLYVLLQELRGGHTENNSNSDITITNNGTNNSDHGSIGNHVMYTSCAGLGPHHKEIDWYERNLEEDSQRIAQLFKKAKYHSWNVIERKTDHEELKSHLESGNIAIVLVDAYVLRENRNGNSCNNSRQICDSMSINSNNSNSNNNNNSGSSGSSDWFGSYNYSSNNSNERTDLIMFEDEKNTTQDTPDISGRSTSSRNNSSDSLNNADFSYSGHYILVVSFDKGESMERNGSTGSMDNDNNNDNNNKLGERYLYLDPAACSGLLAITPQHLERARDVPGTDHDVIYCFC